MLIHLLMILPLVQANNNNTNITGDPILPNKGQSIHRDTVIGEAALGGTIPSILVILLIAVIRIVRVYRLSQQTTGQSIKLEENLDFAQLDKHIREL